MINFDSLPDGNPNLGVDAGFYYATIEKAEMRNPKDATKKPYLNLQYQLQQKDGKGAGKLFDIITESDASIARFKLKRFIQALNLPISGNFELKDLAKIVPGKKFIVEIGKDKNNNNKSVVDVFSNEIFYPLSDAAEVFGETTGADIPFVFEPDGQDAAPTDSDHTEY
jgi:hypothetical protein